MSKEEMIEKCYPYIVRLARSFSESVGFLDFDDFVSEGILVVLEMYEEAMQTVNPSAFLCICVRHKFLHLYRDEKKRICAPIDEEGYIENPDTLNMDPDHILMDATAVRLMMDASISFQGDAREGIICILYLARGFRRAEIARAMKCTLNHVNASISAARKKLRACPDVSRYFREVAA